MATMGYGRAIFCAGRERWGNALLEIFVVATVSLIPLLAGALREVLPSASTIPISDAFSKAFLSGQLLFYAVGLIATIIWQSNKDLKYFFPLRSIFNLYSTMCIVVCSLTIGYDPTLSNINRSTIGVMSVFLFVSAMLVYTLITVISEVHVNVGKDLATDDASLTAQVSHSRGLS